MAEPNQTQGQTENNLEDVAHFYGPMVTGVTVSQQGRVFVSFPSRSFVEFPKAVDEVHYTVAELRDGYEVPYPNLDINQAKNDHDPEAMISVQSVVVDAQDRLWALDTGRPDFQPPSYGGPKLMGFDLGQNRAFQTILFPRNVALPTSYLNDMRFDLRRGGAGVAFITDSSDNGPNAIIVVDLATGVSWRRLHDHPSTKAEPDFTPVIDGERLMVRPAGGPPSPLAMGADGIAFNADGSRLYYSPLAGWRLFSVDIDALVNRDIPEEQVEATVVAEGSKPASDGLESDSQDRLYLADYEDHAVVRRTYDGQFQTVAQDPRLAWPNSLAVANDGYLYITANQYHQHARFHGGLDLRQPPYYLFRVRIDAQPVLLRPHEQQNTDH
ncbi:MAG: major royal jelly protein [Chloroflexi bacterium]|nr:major royal jelly protein [Chloroflexota bacterium]